MKKFGEMTSEELKEAINIIMQKDEEKKEEKGFFAELKEDINNCCSFLKKLCTLQLFKDFCNEPLTKEVFIRRGKKVKEILSEIISTVVFVVVAIIVIRYFVFEIRWIPSPSMHPTLIEQDRVVVDTNYRFKNTPKRGDIMIFYPPEVVLENTPIKLFKRLTGFFCDDIAYIKRVIALPGEKFEIKQDYTGKNIVFINDEPIEEDYVKNHWEYPTCTEDMICGPIIVPENQYFMMGDNRGHSRDSRFFGFIHKDRFIGKASYVARFHKL